MPVDWKGRLAFEFTDGRRFPAKFDFDRDPNAVTEVNVLCFGEPFRAITSPFNLRKTLKFNETTGVCLSSGFVGKIVNVAEDMLVDLDIETGRERTVPISEVRRQIQQAVMAALAGQGSKQRITLIVETGFAKVVSVENMP